MEWEFMAEGVKIKSWHWCKAEAMIQDIEVSGKERRIRSLRYRLRRLLATDPVDHVFNRFFWCQWSRSIKPWKRSKITWWWYTWIGSQGNLTLVASIVMHNQWISTLVRRGRATLAYWWWWYCKISLDCNIFLHDYVCHRQMVKKIHQQKID